MNVYQYVYLARHGETVANQNKIVQGPTAALSERGHDQAKRLAKRATTLSFSHLLASDYVRARQTAEHVAEATGQEIVSEPLLREFARPKSFVGVYRTDPMFQTFLATEIANHANPNWKYEDGDTYLETIARADATLDLFARYNEEALFVVTHGVFMRFIAATVLFQRRPMPEMWSSISRALNMDNTGITVIRRDLATDEWSLQTWNDHAHFADN